MPHPKVPKASWSLASSVLSAEASRLGIRESMETPGCLPSNPLLTPIRWDRPLYGSPESSTQTTLGTAVTHSSNTHPSRIFSWCV